jgi:hypothetical protein
MFSPRFIGHFKLAAALCLGVTLAAVGFKLLQSPPRETAADKKVVAIDD